MKDPNSSNRKKNHLGTAITGWLILVLLLAAVGNLLASDSTRVRIVQTARVANDKILLSDIAEIDGSDPQFIKKLGRIEIGQSPIPGHSRELEGGIIKTRLKQNGIDLSELSLEMPPAVTVSRGYIEVSQEKIKALVADYLAKNLPSRHPDASIKSLEVSEGILLPEGSVTYEVTVPPNRDLAGQFPLAVNFYVDGKMYKRVWTTATIEVLTEVVVTQKPLGRHKPITEDDIMLLKMDLAEAPSDAIRDPETVLGKRARRAIGSKTVLRADLVELPPLVRRGDVVVIVAETNGFKVTALGQVKKKGAIGDRIPVINFDSKKVLHARVIDSNTVKIDF